MHQTKYWHCVEMVEKSSLTIFVNGCRRGPKYYTFRTNGGEMYVELLRREFGGSPEVLERDQNFFTNLRGDTETT